MWAALPVVARKRHSQACQVAHELQKRWGPEFNNDPVDTNQVRLYSDALHDTTPEEIQGVVENLLKDKEGSPK